MEDLYDPEEKIVCPYNNSHHIRRCRMACHLVKCKKNYQGEQVMVLCDFNSTHVVPEPEIQYHHQCCPDRKKVEAPIIEAQNRPVVKYPVPNLSVQPDECWDDLDVPSYDPKKYLENSDVLRALNVASGAERRNFRLEERHRHSALERQQNDNVRPPSPKLVGAVSMPPHRASDTIRDNKFNPALAKEKLKLGANKFFMK